MVLLGISLASESYWWSSHVYFLYVCLACQLCWLLPKHWLMQITCVFTPVSFSLMSGDGALEFRAVDLSEASEYCGLGLQITRQYNINFFFKTSDYLTLDDRQAMDTEDSIELGKGWISSMLHRLYSAWLKCSDPCTISKVQHGNDVFFCGIKEAWDESLYLAIREHWDQFWFRLNCTLV